MEAPRDGLTEPGAPIAEVELSGADTLRSVRALRLVGAAVLLVVALLVLTGGRASPEPGTTSVSLGLVILVLGGAQLYHARTLIQVTATPEGLRGRRGPGDSGLAVVPWTEVRRLAVGYRGHAVIDHDGGRWRTVYWLPWPPMVGEPLELVVSWWQAHAEVRVVPRMIGDEWAADRRAGLRGA